MRHDPIIVSEGDRWTFQYSIVQFELTHGYEQSEFVE